MSLKFTLQAEIKQRGYLSIDELEVLVKKLKYKLSTAERRLRKSESPMIKSVMDKTQDNRDYIKGYSYEESPAVKEIREILERERVKKIEVKQQILI